MNLWNDNFEKLGSDKKLISKEQKRYFNNNLYLYYREQSYWVEACLYYPSSNTRLQTRQAKTILYTGNNSSYIVGKLESGFINLYTDCRL